MSNFSDDLSEGKKAEIYVMNLIMEISFYDATLNDVPIKGSRANEMEHALLSKYDIIMYDSRDTAKLDVKYVEVKFDKLAYNKYPNFYIEFENIRTDKASGLYVTTADFFAIVTADEDGQPDMVYLFNPTKLKEFIAVNDFNIGGVDNNRGYLLPIKRALSELPHYEYKKGYNEFKLIEA